MMESALPVWLGIITIALAPVAWAAKQALNDLSKLKEDLANQRHDMAASYVHKMDLNKDLNLIQNKLDRLETILLERGK